MPHPAAHGPQTCIHLAGWRSKDERDDSIPGDLDILEGAEYVDFPGKRMFRQESKGLMDLGDIRIGEDNTGAAGIFDGEFGLAVLTGDATCDGGMIDRDVQ